MSKTHQHKSQKGYALLLVVFLVAILTLSAITVGPSVMTQDRREKEQDMIWRGQQYVRGISLYRRKLGHFPASLDDLSKGQPGIRFLRKTYKDPFNKQDGSWRLIYMGPSGQIVGSLTHQAFTFPGAPSPAPSGTSSAFGANSASTFNASGQTSPSSFGQANQQNQQSQSTNPSANPSGSTTDTAQQDQNALASGFGSSTPTIVGGSIIGVGGTVNRSSLKIYNKVQNYRLFEFMWDPYKEVTLVSPPAATGQMGDPANPQPLSSSPSPTQDLGSPQPTPPSQNPPQQAPQQPTLPQPQP